MFGLCIGSMVGLRWVSVAASRRISNASVPCRPRVNCHCFYLKTKQKHGIKIPSIFIRCDRPKRNLKPKRGERYLIARDFSLSPLPGLCVGEKRTSPGMPRPHESIMNEAAKERVQTRVRQHPHARFLTKCFEYQKKKVVGYQQTSQLSKTGSVFLRNPTDYSGIYKKIAHPRTIR